MSHGIEMRRSFLVAALSALINIHANAAAALDNAGALRDLEALAARDNFAAAGPLYTGVHDPILRAQLNAQVRSAIAAFISATNQRATQQQYLTLLASEIAKVNRNQLDTEDAEQVATTFEHIMDCVGLQSSNGILNTWMYGFDPR